MPRQNFKSFSQKIIKNNDNIEEFTLIGKKVKIYINQSNLSE